MHYYFSDMHCLIIITILRENVATEGHLMPKHIAVHSTYHLRRTIDDDVFRHRMSVCASSFPEDGYYCYPKHVGTVTVHVLTNSCRVSFNDILMYICCAEDVYYKIFVCTDKRNRSWLVS